LVGVGACGFLAWLLGPRRRPATPDGTDRGDPPAGGRPRTPGGGMTTPQPLRPNMDHDTTPQPGDPEYTKPIGTEGDGGQGTVVPS
jgi:hypothetical protein